MSWALDSRSLAECFPCCHPRARTSLGVISGSLKPLIKRSFEKASFNTAVKPLHENLPLFFREEEFSSTFISDDGL